MIPHSILEQLVLRQRSGRASQALRAYAQREWRGEMPLTPARPRKGGRTLKFRRWLHRRVGKPSATAVEDSAAAPAETPALTVSGSAPCPHSILEDLGFAGSARFLRCGLCGRVLVVQEGRRWTLSAAEPASVGEIPDA